MMRQLKNTPDTMVGFVAYGEVTKEDFDNVIIPAVEDLVKRTDVLNYLLVLNTEIKDFTIGAWMKDALLGITNITKWNRAAIVTDTEGIKIFTNLFSKVVPGEFRGYDQSELHTAIDWVGGGDLYESKALHEEIALKF